MNLEQLKEAAHILNGVVIRLGAFPNPTTDVTNALAAVTASASSAMSAYAAAETNAAWATQANTHVTSYGPIATQHHAATKAYLAALIAGGSLSGATLTAANTLYGDL